MNDQINMRTKMDTTRQSLMQKYNFLSIEYIYIYKNITMPPNFQILIQLTTIILNRHITCYKIHF